MKPKALLTTIPSDSHVWNLIFMELLLKEQGYEVINLGICVSYNLTVTSYNHYKPDIVVVSTVNGHGFIEGITLIKSIKQNGLFKCPVYIGGKLSTNKKASLLHISELEENGYTKAYTNSDLSEFKSEIQKISKLKTNIYIHSVIASA